MARMKDEKRGWAKKTFETIENGPGDRCASPVCRANGKTFQLSMFFLRRVFSRCNKLNVTHIPGARFSITLCFSPVFTVRRLLSVLPARACARGYAWQIAFLSCALYTLSSTLWKKKFFFINTREILRRNAWTVTVIRLAMSRYCSFIRRKYLYRHLEHSG